MGTFGVRLQGHLSCHEKAGSSTCFLLIFSFLLPVLLSSPLALPLLLCVSAVAHQHALVLLSLLNQWKIAHYIYFWTEG